MRPACAFALSLSLSLIRFRCLPMESGPRVAIIQRCRPLVGSGSLRDSREVRSNRPKRLHLPSPPHPRRTHPATTRPPPPTPHLPPRGSCRTRPVLRSRQNPGHCALSTMCADPRHVDSETRARAWLLARTPDHSGLPVNSIKGRAGSDALSSTATATRRNGCRQALAERQVFGFFVRAESLPLRSRRSARMT